MSTAQHHQHLRKRLSRKLAPFPHPIRWKRHLDRAVALLGFLNVFATAPQLYEIWVEENASGVSEISWAYYTVFAFTLVIYGFAHGEKPIIISYLGSTVMYLAITIGAIIY